MQRVQGVINTSPDGEVILEDVEVHIHEARTRGRRRRIWRGSFSVPGTASIDVMGTYHLTLKDGREATIQVVKVTKRSDVRAGNLTAVTFRGLTRLAQPA